MAKILVFGGDGGVNKTGGQLGEGDEGAILVAINFVEQGAVAT